ncbi:hypothetical protein SHIRM173S_10067 [Streptomyces hirsutus]
MTYGISLAGPSYRVRPERKQPTVRSMVSPVPRDRPVHRVRVISRPRKDSSSPSPSAPSRAEASTRASSKETPLMSHPRRPYVGTRGTPVTSPETTRDLSTRNMDCLRLAGTPFASGAEEHHMGRGPAPVDGPFLAGEDVLSVVRGGHQFVGGQVGAVAGLRVGQAGDDPSAQHRARPLGPLSGVASDPGEHHPDLGRSRRTARRSMSRRAIARASIGAVSSAAPAGLRPASRARSTGATRSAPTRTARMPTGTLM